MKNRSEVSPGAGKNAPELTVEGSGAHAPDSTVKNSRINAPDATGEGSREIASDSTVESPRANAAKVGENHLRYEGENDPVVPGAMRPPQRETYYEFTIAADEEFMQMYRRVRSLQLIKGAPGQDIAATFKALMQEYIARHAPEEKQKRRVKRREAKVRRERFGETQEQSYGSTRRPACETPDRGAATLEGSEKKKPRSRYIPAATKDRVLLRDHYQCTYIGIDGARCRATQHLQFDHVTPFARGGESTVENLRLLCSAHNRLEAKGVFGPAVKGRVVPAVIRERTPRYHHGLFPTIADALGDSEGWDRPTFNRGANRLYPARRIAGAGRQ